MKLRPWIGTCFSKIAFRVLFRRRRLHEGLDKTMWNKGLGLFEGLLFFLPCLLAVMDGRQTGFFFEEDAEGSKAFEAQAITDIRDAEVHARQSMTGFLDPFADEVLVRRFPVDAGKKSVKVKAGNACFAGKPVQVDGLPEVIIQIYFGRNDLLIYVRGNGHTGIKINQSNLIFVIQTPNLLA